VSIWTERIVMTMQGRVVEAGREKRSQGAGGAVREPESCMRGQERDKYKGRGRATTGSRKEMV
jgi:hypothetical protein